MNGFDIMLAPSGSHMANLLFLLSPNKAVIEVGAVCMEANLNVNFKYILSPFYCTVIYPRHCKKKLELF